VLALTAVVAALGCLVSSAAATTQPKPGSGPFGEFRACMKANGAPTLGHRLSPDERAALRKAFAACRGLLPKPRDRARHPFTRPSAAQIAAFKACMANRGFDSTTPRPDLRDATVRKALRAALMECLPLLKPRERSTG
jgi:hypothetical protein